MSCSWRSLVALAPLLAAHVAMAAAPTSSTDEHRALMISAQVMQKEGNLLRARDLLSSCSESPCPGGDGAVECQATRSFCGARLGEVSAEIPTVRVEIRDDRGLLVQPDTFEIDAVAIHPFKTLELDPGTHSAKALYAGRIGETVFELRRGQKGVVVVVRVDLRTTVSHRPIPAAVWALGATTLASGLLSIGTGVYTVEGYQALSACRPYCDSSQRGLLGATGYVADVAGLVAIASAVGALIWFLARPTVREVRWLHTTTTGAP